MASERLSVVLEEPFVAHSHEGPFASQLAGEYDSIDGRVLVEEFEKICAIFGTRSLQTSICCPARVLRLPLIRLKYVLHPYFVLLEKDARCFGILFTISVFRWQRLAFFDRNLVHPLPKI